MHPRLVARTQHAVGRGEAVADALVRALILMFATISVIALGLYGSLAHQIPALERIGSASPASLSALATTESASSWLVAYRILLELLMLVVCVVAAALLLRKPTPFTRFLAVVLVFFGSCSGIVPVIYSTVWPTLTFASELMVALAWASFFSIAYLFPTGRFVPRWSAWCVPAWILFALVATALPVSNPAALTLNLLGVSLVVSALAAQCYRYFRVSSAIERQQTKWVLLAFLLRLVHLILLLTVLPQLSASAHGVGAVVVDALGMLVSYAIAAALVIGILLAMLTYRLFDVDIVMSRTLVYAALCSALVFVALGVVALVGLVWPIGASPLPTISAALTVALLVVPLHNVVKQLVNRWIFGAHDDPYAVIARLGAQLAETQEPRELLESLVRTVRQSLRYPYVGLEVDSADVGVIALAAGRTTAGHAVSTFQIYARDELLGSLTVEPRHGEKMTDREQRLLGHLADQAGAAVHTALLTESLLRARERVVAIRDDERRRLQRDLHDGLGPTLASLFQRIELAESMLAVDPDASVQFLAEAKVQMLDTLEEVRRLVNALRPQPLETLGLHEALREAARSVTGNPTEVRVRVDLPGNLSTLAPHIETATYRICLEAVTNVRRHAAANECLVCLSTRTDSAGMPTHVLIEVSDDGVGMPARPGPGTGLRSMTERAEELGGRVEIRSGTGAGTTIIAVLPLDARQDVVETRHGDKP